MPSLTYYFHAFLSLIYHVHALSYTSPTFLLFSLLHMAFLLFSLLHTTFMLVSLIPTTSMSSHTSTEPTPSHAHPVIHAHISTPLPYAHMYRTLTHKKRKIMDSKGDRMMLIASTRIGQKRHIETIVVHITDTCSKGSVYPEQII